MGTQMTPEEVRMFLGKRIRSLRKTQGWTQEELAEHADLSHKYIGEVERGEVNPSLDTLLGISNALKIDVAELFLTEELIVLTGKDVTDVKSALSVLDGVLGNIKLKS
jgi:transcriptional regulator with XRE-family HTH domain